MNEDIFEFDIDAQLEEAETRAQQKVAELPEVADDEAECESCKI